jgi:hypothetical protein
MPPRRFRLVAVEMRPRPLVVPGISVASGTNTGPACTAPASRAEGTVINPKWSAAHTTAYSSQLLPCKHDRRIALLGPHTYPNLSRGSLFHIASIWLRPDDARVAVQHLVGVKNCHFRPGRLWGLPRPPGHWVLGFFLQGVKRPEHEGDLSPPTSAEIKKTTISLHGVVLHQFSSRDSFASCATYL